MNHQPPVHLQQTDSNSTNLPIRSSWPLIPDSASPPPPFYPVSQKPGQQALFTSFPSRLRLGTTSLVQPIFTNTYIHHRLQRPNSPVELNTLNNSHSHSHQTSTAANIKNYFNSSINGSSLVSDLGSRRTRKVVNYSEQNDSSRVVEVDPHIISHSDDISTPSNSRNRLLLTNKSFNTTSAHHHQNSTGLTSSTPVAEFDERRQEADSLVKRKYADGKLYLGEEPPAKFIRVQRRLRKPQGIMTAIALAELSNNDSQSVEQDDNDGDQHETLVPIRIEFETDDLRIRDVFTWNLRERHISPEAFAIEFCHDIDITPSVYAPRIVEQINSQLKDFSSISSTKLSPPSNEIEAVEPDIRVIICLDVQIQTLHLVDRIEWDLASTLTPELFTSQYISELHLPTSSQPIIAHAIHEELVRHKRECLALGIIGSHNHHQNGANSSGYYNDPLLRDRKGPKKLEGIWREWNEASGFGPKVEEVLPEDVEWLEMEKERLFRRARRETVRPGRRR